MRQLRKRCAPGTAADRLDGSIWAKACSALAKRPETAVTGPTAASEPRRSCCAAGGVGDLSRWLPDAMDPSQRLDSLLCSTPRLWHACTTLSMTTDDSRSNAGRGQVAKGLTRASPSSCRTSLLCSALHAPEPAAEGDGDRLCFAASGQPVARAASDLLRLLDRGSG